MGQRAWIAVLAALVLGALGGLAWWAGRADEGPGGGAATALAPGAGPGRPSPARADIEPAAPIEVERADATAGQPEPRRAAAPATEPAPSAPPDGSIWRDGRVVLRNGTPVDEAIRVEARGKRFRSGVDGRSFHADADREGRFRVAFAEGTRTGWVELSARYLYLDDKLKVDVDDDPSELVLEPKLGGLLRGRVLPPPVLSAEPPDFADTQVILYDWSGSGFFRRAGSIDEEGGFELGGVPPGSQYRLQVESRRWADATRESVEVRPGEVTELELELSLGARLVGRVVDAEGEGLSGVTLRLTSKDDDDSSTESEQPEEDGGFDLRGVSPGEVELTAVHPDHLDAELSLGALADGDVREGILVRMSSGRAVAGVVRWPDGSPAEGAWVQLAQEKEDRDPWSWIDDTAREKTDGEGRFRFSGLEDAPCQLRATARGERTKDATGRSVRPTFVAQAEGVAPDTRGLELVLGQGDRLAGRVVDDRGQPVTRFRVVAEAVGEEALDATVAGGFADDEGRFELAGLTDGDWEVRAEARGHADAIPFGLTAPHAGGELVLELRRLARVAGRVLSPAGEPVSGARVSVSTGEGNRVVYVGGNRVDGEATDDEGEFEVDDAEPGSCRVVARADGYAESEALELELAPAGEALGLRLVLRRAGRIEGEVHPAAGEVSGRDVSVSREGGGYWTRERTGADGRFVVDALTPGTYQVTLEPEPAREGETESDWALRNSQRRRTRVELAEGQTARVVLGEPAARQIRVSGVVRSGGAPVEGVTVAWDAVRGEGRAGTRTAADGSYGVALDGPGTWRVSIGSDWNDRLTMRAEVPDAESWRYDVELPRGGLAGTVRGPGGEPLARCPVELSGGPPEEAEGPGWRDTRRTTTDEEGRYSFDRLRPGAYTITAGGARPWENPSLSAYGRARLRGVALEGGQQRTGLDLELVRGGAVEGTVLDAAGRPVTGVWIEVHEEEGEGSWYGEGTDGDGRFRITALSPGTVRLRARRDQEFGEFVEVRVLADQTARVELSID